MGTDFAALFVAEGVWGWRRDETGRCEEGWESESESSNSRYEVPEWIGGLGSQLSEEELDPYIVWGENSRRGGGGGVVIRK